MEGAKSGGSRRGCVVVVVLCVLAICAAACVTCLRDSAPATTEQLLVRYAALADVDDFVADVALDLGVSGTGFRSRIPIASHFEAAEGTAHGTIVADLSSLDLGDYAVEVYAELLDKQLMCYIGKVGDDAAAWKSWAVDLTQPIDVFTLTNLLSASELSIVAKDSDEKAHFELSVPTKVALDTAFEIMSDHPDVDMADFENDHIIFDFTRDCRLRSAFTTAMFAASVKDTTTKPAVSLDVSAILDGYGTVEPAQVAIPEAVRQSAVPTEDPIDVRDVVGGEGALAEVLAKEDEAA